MHSLGIGPQMSKVLFIQEQLKGYRVPLFQKLNALLRARGIELCVAYSPPCEEERSRGDNAELPSTFGLQIKARRFSRGRLVWQPLLREGMLSDLVICPQANRMVLNHLLLPMARIGGKKVALFGLGENKQADRSRLSEWYKRRTANWVHWWFAYTQTTAEYLIRANVPADRITVVQNAIDTRELRSQVERFGEADVVKARAQLGIGTSDCVAVYCGMLHPVKALPFLLESSSLIRRAIPNFHLILMGGGPEQSYVESKCEGSSWIHVLGPRFGTEKALMLRIADVALQPGRVGLVILDCFAAGLPLVTTRLTIHGPEMDYFEHGQNGLITDSRPTDYSSAVIEVLQNREKLDELRDGSLASSNRYSVEAMASRFCNGICKAMGVTCAATDAALAGVSRDSSIGGAQ